MTQTFNFLTNSNINSPKTASMNTLPSSTTTSGTASETVSTVVPSATTTAAPIAAGTVAPAATVADPSTPSAPPPFGMTAFTFNHSTTPLGQPPAHPLGQSSDNKGFHTETKNSTGGLFNITMGTTPQNHQTTSTTTPFVFGTATPPLNTKSGSQDKPTTTFSFTGFPEKNTQTLQEESSKTPSFSFSGSKTPAFSFETNEKKHKRKNNLLNTRIYWKI
ncbi:hypothetical protein PCK1_002229 [Pneumocystis canis]|nr:hypothetical protein PCK1_002229 [Pneumocystis canis]